MFRSGRRLCALAAEYVEESMRPLPVQPLPGLPRFVCGTAIVRGTPTPVVDLRELLGDETERPPLRMLSVRAGAHRRVGLLVDEVVGLREALSVEMLPPLLSDAAPGVVEHLGRLDRELLTVLRAGSLLPEEVWAHLETT